MQYNNSKNRIRLWALAFATPLVALAFGLGGSASAAPVETVLYSFCHRLNCDDGGYPFAGLIADKNGNLYGTASRGGATKCLSGKGCGAVFKLTPKGGYTVLHGFKGTDGSTPLAGVTADSSGNIYGTTYLGGASNFGTVFKITITPTTSFQVLHTFSFDGNGAFPYSGLVADSSGNLYGAASGGPGCCGTAFKLSPSGGNFTLLYSFCRLANCGDGYQPLGDLIADSSGNLYGTTVEGGASRYGTVFKLAPDGTETVLHSFCSVANCTDGTLPGGPLVAVSSGNLYGTTVYGGTAGCSGWGCGTVFKLSASGALTTLHSFTGGSDGEYPTSLIADSSGNLYGATVTGGGAAINGTVFKLSPSGALTTLYSFMGGSDGSGPTAGLIADTSGNLFGTTSAGGASNAGVVFKLTGTGFVPAKL